jgi:5'-3' exoribonuclease 1
MSFKFDLGTPFKPFEQLMGVLPVASREHIPLAYQVCGIFIDLKLRLKDVVQDLMYELNSPILDFYPLEFEQDLNGKKQDWEAIVKIPFIDEVRLLRAMACGYSLFQILDESHCISPSSSRTSTNSRREKTEQLWYQHKIYL